MPPRQNLLFMAGLIAGFFVLAFVLHAMPVAEADTPAAQEARQELRVQAAAAKACGPGHAALWIDPTTVECHKEIEP